MNNESKPSYYAVLPAIIRYDKELTPNAKLLYAEITCLCNEKGYCWATNKYFSTLYSVSDRTIQYLLKQLSEKKYIKVEIIENTNRKIFINDISKDLINKKALKKIEIVDYDWLNESE